MICPIDGKCCIDDLCRSSLRCFETGEPMLKECSGCGQLIACDGSDNELCLCYLEYEDYDELD